MIGGHKIILVSHWSVQAGESEDQGEAGEVEQLSDDISVHKVLGLWPHPGPAHCALPLWSRLPPALLPVLLRLRLLVSSLRSREQEDPGHVEVSGDRQDSARSVPRSAGEGGGRWIRNCCRVSGTRSL